jgi:L-ascorbate metabolism protein UlaG (beta-lactamase superfamily)
MNITHFGHACLLVETDARARLLFDPGTASTGFEGLRDLTAVIISHQHDDHVDVDRVAALMAANPDAVLLADHETAPQLGALSVRVVSPGEHLDLGGSVVEVLGGRHAHIFEDWPQFANNAYLVDGGAFFHPGDSFEVPAAQVDVLAVPISGPWLKLGDSIAFVRAVAPRVAVPMHELALEAESLGQAHFMVGMHAPDDTAYTPLERGVATAF